MPTVTQLKLIAFNVVWQTSGAPMLAKCGQWCLISKPLSIPSTSLALSRGVGESGRLIRMASKAPKRIGGTLFSCGNFSSEAWHGDSPQLKIKSQPRSGETWTFWARRVLRANCHEGSLAIPSPPRHLPLGDVDLASRSRCDCPANVGIARGDPAFPLSRRAG